MMISFLIVNWNGGDVLKQCIYAIEKNISQAGIRNYEIVIVDNHSADLDARWLLSRKNLRLQRNTKNQMFAAGTNQCVKYSSGDILFFLNNDVVLGERCLAAMLPHLQGLLTDAVVPKLLYPNGDIQYSIRGFPTLFNIAAASVGLHLFVKRLDTWLLRHFDYTQEQTVDQPMFSAVFMDRATWNQVGQMDEKFPLLFNDVDWFFRFQQQKLKCLYLPQAKATHVHGMSVNKHMFKKVIVSVTSMIFYFHKHYQFGFFRASLLYGISAFMALIRILREAFIYLKNSNRGRLNENF